MVRAASAALAVGACIAVTSCRSGSEAPGPALARQTLIEDGGALGIGRLVTLPEAASLGGGGVTGQDLLKGRAGAVFVMTSVGCPLSTRYAPRLAKFEQEYTRRGVAFVWVNTVGAETEEEMRAWIRENEVDGPYLPDRDRSVASALRARTTTEVFVIDAARTLVYRGAVDDQYGIGTALAAPSRTFLRDALDALLEGRRPRIGATWAPGCLLDTPALAASDTEGPTYHGRVSRILAANCVDCHRAGGVAPFGLETYASLKGRASMIEAVVRDGLMPPSHGDVTGGPFASPRAMTSEDRDDLIAWLRSSRAVGERGDAPVVPPLPRTWSIGEPDLLLLTPAVRLPAEGPLTHARLMVPINQRAERWINAIEMRPVMRDTVHHALVWIVPPGAAMPAAGEMPGGLELLGAYSAAGSVVRYGEGVARRLPAGSSLLVDLYARPMGREVNGVLRIAVRYAAAAPAMEVRTLAAQDEGLAIPAGAASARGEAAIEPSETMRVVAISPFMRARGRAVGVEALPPGGEAAQLLDAPRYDFRWQLRYEFAEPLELPGGTRITVRGLFDNSAANPNNPDPGADVRAGPGVEAEALVACLEILKPVAGASRADNRTNMK